MLKHIPLTIASLVVLSACSACSNLDTAEVQPSVENLPTASSDEGSAYEFQANSTVTTQSDSDRIMVAAVSGYSIYYDFDSSALKPEARAELKHWATYLNNNRFDRVTVEGHADERGTREYNLALGDRRAVAAKKYLVGLGVPADKITTISYGKERPANTGHTAEDWALNRRATIIVN